MSTSEQQFGSVRVASEVPDIDPVLSDTGSLLEHFKRLNIIDNINVNDVKIVFTSENTNPMTVQQDESGNDIISSGFTYKDNGIVEIQIWLSQQAKELSIEQKTSLANYYFWESANLVSKRNTKINKDITDKPTVFISL